VFPQMTSRQLNKRLMEASMEKPYGRSRWKKPLKAQQEALEEGNNWNRYQAKEDRVQ